MYPKASSFGGMSPEDAQRVSIVANDVKNPALTKVDDLGKITLTDDAAKAAEEGIKAEISDNLSGLTQKEIDSINKYTGDDYWEINRSLRGLEEATDANNITIKNMKSALDKASLPEDMTLYRGTDKVELGNLKDLSTEELIGKTFVQPSFMSTSTKNNVATGTFQGNMHMTIEAPKGSKGMDIASISQYGGTEAEVLFQAGTEMIIKDATVIGNVLNIVVEIIN